MKIRSIGIDLGKTTFHLIALGERGKILLKKKLSRKQLLSFTANLDRSLIGMEACSGSHFLGRALSQQGHGCASDWFRAAPRSSTRCAPSSWSGALPSATGTTDRVAQQRDRRHLRRRSRLPALRQIPGVGPLVATAVVAAIGNGAVFHKGREFSAWLGLIPKQYSTGGKAKLLGISKRGNPIYARCSSTVPELRCCG